MRTKRVEMETDVLYQRLGNVWYAICEVNGEITFTALPQDVHPLKDCVEFNFIDEGNKKAVSKVKNSSVETAA